MEKENVPSPLRRFIHVPRSGETRRRARMLELVDAVRAGSITTSEAAVLKLALEFGLTKRTALEYVLMLSKAGYVVMGEGGAIALGPNAPAAGAR